MLKRYLPVVIALTFLFGVSPLSRAAGTSSDPVITLGWLNQTFNEAVGQRADAAWKPLLEQITAKLTAKKTEALQSVNQKGLVNWMADGYIERTGGARTGYANRFANLSLNKGDTITGAIGTVLVLRAGNARISGVTGQTAINITTGVDAPTGADTVRNQQYLLLTTGGAGFVITSDKSAVAVRGGYRVAPGYPPKYFDLADALHAMRLFLGTPTGYNLQRPATRLEGLVMMLRLFGEEKAALAYAGDSPFTDLPDWGRPYVAYAYGKGYTKGTSTYRFTPDESITPDQYMSFMLRALGYSDNTGGDFVWDRSVAYAVGIKLFSAAEEPLIRNPFYRDQMVYISYYALTGRVKGGSNTLLDRLTGSGAVSAATAKAAMDKVKRIRP